MEEVLRRYELPRKSSSRGSARLRATVCPVCGQPASNNIVDRAGHGHPERSAEPESFLKHVTALCGPDLHDQPRMGRRGGSPRNVIGGPWAVVSRPIVEWVSAYQGSAVPRARSARPGFPVARHVCTGFLQSRY
jgi:hypothetical protein